MYTVYWRNRIKNNYFFVCYLQFLYSSYKLYLFNYLSTVLHHNIINIHKIQTTTDVYIYIYIYDRKYNLWIVHCKPLLVNYTKISRTI